MDATTQHDVLANPRRVATWWQRRRNLLFAGVLGALSAACGYGGGDSGASNLAIGDEFVGNGSVGQEFGATQGGAQDAGLARVLIEAGQVPPPGAFKVEGYFSEHDLPITGPACETLLCLRSALGVAPTLAGRRSLWVQVGMSSTISAETWERPSLGLVATLDVSGSMGWNSYNAAGNTPGQVATHLTLEITRRLNGDDRVAMVAFGSHVDTVLQPVTGGDAIAIAGGFDKLQTGGGTNIEKGLRRAFAVAQDMRAEGVDEVRVLLMSDAQPNEGGTTSALFESLAAEAAADGIALTVFGIGIGLDADIYSAMAELRGGNAYSLVTRDDADQLLAENWPWFAAPIATDLQVDLAIPEGYLVAETFGFPAGGNESFLPSLVVESVFPSTRRGALLARLVEAGDRFDGFELDGRIDYTASGGERIGANLSSRFDSSELAGDYAFEQTGVARAVALAILVTGMQEAAQVYGYDPYGAATTLRQAVRRFAADIVDFNDPGFAAELDQARALLELMEAGADQGSLYGG